MIQKVVNYINAKGRKYFFKTCIKKITQNIIRYLKYLKAKVIFLIHYTYYKKIYNKYKGYIVSSKTVYGLKKREKGISAYMRICNEEEFLEITIESHISYIDELCILYQKSEDKSEEIIKRIKKKYPEKVKIKYYGCPVTKPKTQEYLATPAHYPTSYINYWNYNLKMTTLQSVFKLDGDHLAISDNFQNAVNIIKRKGIENTFYYFFGINLYQKNGEIMINPKDILTGIFDHGFFNLRPGREYKKGLKFETNKNLIDGLQLKSAGILYFHLKGLKKDLGVSTYTNNKKKKKQMINERKKDALISRTKFIKQYKTQIKKVTGENIENIPNPNKYLSKNNINLTGK